MRTDDKVLKVMESGIAPISLTFSEAVRFDGRPSILRSSLRVSSLALGTLTFDQYRYVAGRYKRGTELFARHADKLFAWYSEARPKAGAVTLPVLSSTLLSGAASRTLFETFAKHPRVNAGSIMVEVSADILFEEQVAVRSCLDEISSLGVKLAVFEAANEYCPLMRLSEIGARCIFVDPYAVKNLSADSEGASGLPAMLHSGGAEVFAPILKDEALIALAKEAGYDGYLAGSEVIVDG